MKTIFSPSLTVVKDPVSGRYAWSKNKFAALPLTQIIREKVGGIRFLLKDLSKTSFFLLFFCLSATFQILAQPYDIEPENAVRCRGESVKFEVQATGIYQWEKLDGATWKPIEGGEEVRNKNYVTNETGFYRCEVRIGSDIFYSKPCTLKINDPPQIGSIHVPAVCHRGVLKANAVDVVNNGSDMLEYTWRLNGTIVDPPCNLPEYTRDPAVDSENGWVLTLTVSNECGPSQPARAVLDIKPTPARPSLVVRDYCRYDPPTPLAIAGENEAIWYDNPYLTGGSPEAPTPNTNVASDIPQKWWVAQKVLYADEGISCSSDTVRATVYVLELSDSPMEEPVTTKILCMSESAPVFQISGVDIRWYDDLNAKQPLQTAPQINTSDTVSQTFYVTQKVPGKCESPRKDGTIKVKIRDLSNVEDIIISNKIPSLEDPLCPNNIFSITVTSQGTNPIFRWYSNQNKTGLLQENSTPVSTFTTPDVLMSDAVYYVSIEQDGMCESSFPKAIIIYVRDNDLPKIEAPKSIEVFTDPSTEPGKPGKCYASGVNVGWPVVSDECTTDERDLKIFINDVNIEVTYPHIRDYPLGDSTLIWWVEDIAGNMDKAWQNISVRDREKPVGTCPPDIVKDIDESETSLAVSYDFFYIDNYEDNCSGRNVTYTRDAVSLPSGSDFELGKHLIRHFIRDAAGNEEICEFYIIVQHPRRQMEVTLLYSPGKEICPNEELVLTSKISGGSGRVSYLWSPRAWTKSEIKDYPPMGVTRYELTVSDSVTTEKVTKFVDITVLQTRQVELTLEGKPMDEIFEGDEVLVTANPNDFDTYKLQINGETIQEIGIYNSISFQAELGTYTIRVFATDNNSCVTQDQMLIEVDSKKLPDVFTPNFDGLNDVFLEFLEKPDAPDDFHLEVYTRAGVLLHKGNKGWNGMHKGKMMPQGTYIYMVKRKMNSGEYRIFKGNVTLKL